MNVQNVKQAAQMHLITEVSSWNKVKGKNNAVFLSGIQDFTCTS